jgi:hypothetical protein
MHGAAAALSVGGYALARARLRVDDEPRSVARTTSTRETGSRAVRGIR